MVWVDKIDKDAFPLFLDYDLEKKRCRGFSCRLDFFTFGSISSILDTFSDKEIEYIKKEGLFIRKDGLIFDSGFFLFDFSIVFKNIDSFLEKTKNMNAETLYFENSDYHDMKGLVSKIKWSDARLVELSNAPYSQG